MNVEETPNQKQSTLFQRLIARLCDPSPTRYSAVMELRTFGRVSLEPDSPSRPSWIAAAPAPVDAQRVSPTGITSGTAA